MLQEHISYLVDRVKIDLYQAAITSCVGRGTTVLDLGCGSGILGLLALRCGAAHVVFLDQTKILEVARETIAREGFSDRATFLSDSSFRTSLSSKIDIIICDHVGYFGFDYNITRTLYDAKSRFLAPGGTVIPRRVVPFVAGVRSDRLVRLAAHWDREQIPAAYGWLHKHVVNEKYAAHAIMDDIMTSCAKLGDIQMGDASGDFLSWSATLMAEDTGELYGLLGWFNSELADGVWMTNSPFEANRINRPQAFMPLDASIQLDRGASIEVTVSSRPADALLAWSASCAHNGRSQRQSTLGRDFISPQDIVRFNPYRPAKLTKLAQLRLAALSRCDGSRTVQQVEEMTLAEFREFFPTEEEARKYLQDVLARNCK